MGKAARRARLEVGPFDKLRTGETGKDNRGQTTEDRELLGTKN
jgi:hypothetical protein